jgi:hypothetical protein
MVIQVSQDVFPFPVKAVMEYLAKLSQETFDGMLIADPHEQRYLRLSMPKGVREDILSLPAIISKDAKFMGVDFDVEAHDLIPMANKVFEKIDAAVDRLGDIRWVLDDSHDARVGNLSSWDLDTVPAHLESARNWSRLTKDAEGVLLVVREHRDTQFEQSLRRRLIEHLTDPMGEGLDSIEAEARVARALSADISQKFLEFVRTKAVNRSRVGVMIGLARALCRVLEQNPKKSLGYRYLRFIMEMYDTVLREPRKYRLESGFEPGSVAGSLSDEMHKLHFFNKLPVWFLSRGVLGREDSQNASADLVSYSLRIGGVNPDTGNLAVVDNISKAFPDLDRDRAQGRAYMPAVLVYAMLFDPEFSGGTFSDKYARIMDAGWPSIQDRWMCRDAKTGAIGLDPDLKSRIGKFLKNIRDDLFWGLQQTANNALGEYLLRGDSDLGSEVTVRVGTALMSFDVENGIVDRDGLKYEDLEKRWLQHVLVNDPSMRSDAEWFRLQVSATPDVRLLVTDHKSVKVPVRRVPLETERVLRVLAYPGSMQQKENRDLRRERSQHRRIRFFVQAYFLEQNPAPEHLVGYFAQMWLVKHFLQSVLRKVWSQSGANVRLDILRMQEGGRGDPPSNRMYAFGHILEQLLGKRVPVFQQGLNGSAAQEDQNAIYRVQRADAMAVHVWPMELALPIDADVALVHLSRFSEDDGKTAQALARAWIAQPTDFGFRYGHYRTWSRASRNLDHASLFSESWILATVLKGLRATGVRRVLLVVSAEAWMRSWRGFAEQASEELSNVYNLGERVLGEGAVVIPMAWRKHLLLMRKKSKVERPLILDGVDALSDVLPNLTDSDARPSLRTRILACQGFATLRVVQDHSPQRGLMAYGFLYADGAPVRASSEAARQAALAKSGWVHHVLLAHHACAYEKVRMVGKNIVPVRDEPPIRLDPWSMEIPEDRGCEVLSLRNSGKHKLTLDWLSLLNTFDLQVDRAAEGSDAVA